MPTPLTPLSGLIHALWWLPLLPIAAALLGLPATKGWIGEATLHLALWLGLPRQRYHLRRNVTLPTVDGSTQIDHVVVSRHGVFVIETKNYGGWIFGKPQDKMWTQKFPRRSSAFQNPLRQNHKHVRTLAELAALAPEHVFSLVVFVGDSTFKTEMPPNVTRLAGCLAFIRGRSDLLLDEAEVVRVLAAIDGGRLAPTRATHAAHVRHVRALVEQRAAGAAPAPAPAPPAAPAPAPCCPRCGGALGDYAYKTGPHAGQAFRGCTRFPACTWRSDLATAPA